MRSVSHLSSSNDGGFSCNGIEKNVSASGSDGIGECHVLSIVTITYLEHKQTLGLSESALRKAIAYGKIVPRINARKHGEPVGF